MSGRDIFWVSLVFAVATQHLNWCTPGSFWGRTCGQCERGVFVLRFFYKAVADCSCQILSAVITLLHTRLCVCFNVFLLFNTGAISPLQPAPCIAELEVGEWWHVPVLQLEKAPSAAPHRHAEGKEIGKRIINPPVYMCFVVCLKWIPCSQPHCLAWSQSHCLSER